jgi:hypothetical protein
MLVKLSWASTGWNAVVPNKDIKEAVALMLEPFLKAMKIMRERGYSDADIEAMLALIEQEKLTQADPEVLAVALEEIRIAASSSSKS